jgi:hypothetical protein
LIVFDLDRPRRQSRGHPQPRAISIMQLEHGITGAKLDPGLRHDHDSRRVIDRVFDAIPSSPECNRRTADHCGIQPGEKALSWRSDHVAFGRGRNTTIVVDDVGVAALLFDDPPKPLQAGTRGNGAANLVLRL